MATAMATVTAAAATTLAAEAPSLAIVPAASSPRRVFLIVNSMLSLPFSFIRSRAPEARRTSLPGLLAPGFLPGFLSEPPYTWVLPDKMFW